MKDRHISANWRRLAWFTLAILASTIAGLWAYNTIAELLGTPAAQYKHAIAALLLLWAVRFGSGARGHRLDVR